jgi:hypothetical protein
MVVGVVSIPMTLWICYRGTDCVDWKSESERRSRTKDSVMAGHGV